MTKEFRENVTRHKQGESAKTGPQSWAKKLNAQMKHSMFDQDITSSFHTEYSTGHMCKWHAKADVYSTQAEVNFGSCEPHKPKHPATFSSDSNSHRAPIGESRFKKENNQHSNTNEKKKKVIETDHILIEFMFSYENRGKTAGLYASCHVVCSFVEAKPKMPWRREEVKIFRRPLSLMTPAKQPRIFLWSTRLPVRETEVCTQPSLLSQWTHWGPTRPNFMSKL